ncbi:aspartate kinase [Sulfolobales archaeon HS-7]|nr:aspartate kinase [Sulfolobales archaeon HS-7]
MSIEVIKIGGSVLSRPKDYELIIDKIKQELANNERLVLVVSATKNTTDDLIRALYDRKNASHLVNLIYKRTLELLSKVSTGDVFEKAFSEVSELATQMERIAWSLAVLDTITPRISDYFLSFGERISSVIMWSALKSAGLRVAKVRDVPLITDKNYGNASINEESSAKKLRQLVTMDDKVMIVPGFIGISEDGDYTTLGRGGSDYSATIIGKLLGVKTIKMITDVPGLLSGDPRIFKDAHTIPQLSFEEAAALSTFGAKKFHPKTFDPLIGSEINVNIEGLYDNAYTVVNSSIRDPPLKGVALTKRLFNIRVNRSDVTLSKLTRELNTMFGSFLGSTVNVITDELKGVENPSNVIGVAVVGYGISKKRIYSEIIKIASDYELFSIVRNSDFISTFIIPEKEAFDFALQIHDKVISWIR